jgi:diguanylate cyclase (GGDEF)-like protein
MRTLEELGLVPAWVNPEHLVATAVHVMQGHKINAVAVLRGAELHGLVTLERALNMPGFARVDSITQPVSLKLDELTTVRSAAKEFIDADVNYAAVYRGDEFRGLVTATMLLREIGQSWDPLTSLPWSNRLRDWGLAELGEGNEITIAFVDIDDFGNYNKKHGHIVGDKILRVIASKLRGFVDRHTDILVRYGGDEFVIGTRLDRYTAEKRLGEIGDLQITVDDVPDPVLVTVGFAGGMRTQEREHAHVSSMLDNLINLASQDCTRKKQEKTKSPEPTEQQEAFEPVPEPEVELQPSTNYDVRLVSLDEDDPTKPVAVTLSIDGTDGTGAAMPDGPSMMDAVAQAAARAIERIRPGVKLTITTTVVDTASDGSKVVTVVGSCDAGGRRHAMAGTCPVARDVHRAVAEAVAAAFVSVA